MFPLPPPDEERTRGGCGVVWEVEEDEESDWKRVGPTL